MPTEPTRLGLVVAMSDQKVSLRRSSHGKSNSVASMPVVTSIDTRSTQSKVSPTGSSSRISMMRLRISGSRKVMLRGAATGCVTLRCASCLTPSMVMNPASSGKSGSGSPSTMLRADEKISGCFSTVRTSSYFVTDQYGPNSLSGQRWTGSSFRRRSK